MSPGPSIEIREAPREALMGVTARAGGWARPRRSNEIVTPECSTRPAAAGYELCSLAQYRLMNSAIGSARATQPLTSSRIRAIAPRISSTL